MKKKIIIYTVKASLVISALAVCAVVGIKSFDIRLSEVKAYDTSPLPTTIDLNDCSDEDIRAYYSSLNSLSEEERKGNNLLKNLKPILKQNQKYYSYDTDSSGLRIWQLYEIADRDWNKSPASELSGYDANTNTITGYKYGTSATDAGTNPYLHSLYVNRSVENHQRAWALEGTTKVSHGNNAEWCIDREHIWPKSQGFETKGKGGARGDPMHLWSGDSDVNSALHNDQFFGFVDLSKTKTQGKWSYNTDNYQGISLTIGSGDKVFEPQDSDKGDIARSIFYMVARYNCLSGSDPDGIDSNNPNLELVQSNDTAAGYDSTTTITGKMGILTDLLEWNHLDPVDEFEIHRNNLLYKNFTNNRNPFIDFPEWADFIWGTATYSGRNYQSYDSTPTGSANPQTDAIAADVVVTKLEITKLPNKLEYKAGEKFDKTGMEVIATLEDSTTRNVTNSCSIKVDLSSAGEKDVTVSYKGKTATFKVNVTKAAGMPMWLIIVIVAAVVVLLIIGISVGVISINKKGKVKVKKSGVKKAIKKSNSKNKK